MAHPPRRQLCVPPCRGAISVSLGPVTVPALGAVVRLGYVMPSFAVAGEVEELVRGVVVFVVAIEIVDVLCVALPLG